MIYCRLMTTQVERFWSWVEEERSKRDLSYRAIESAGNVANGTVSSRARRLLPPTATTLQAISRAFNLPFDFVAKQTVAQSSSSPSDPLFEQARHLLDQLSEDEKDIVLSQMRALVERKERREREKREQGRRGVEPGAQPA
jgi:transcriptional regulator with XRE-family HTH domain